MIPNTLPGDVGLTSSKTWLSKSIRFFGKLQTGSANRSHAFACIGNDQMIESLVRVRINDLKKYENEDCEIWRLPLDDEDRINFKKGMLKIAGDSYGWGKIPLHALDSMASIVTRKINGKPTFYFTSKLGITSFKDCSQTVVYGLHKFTKYRILDEDHKEVQWRTVSPDYLQDLLWHPHNNAKLIHEQRAI